MNRLRWLPYKIEADEDLKLYWKQNLLDLIKFIKWLADAAVTSNLPAGCVQHSTNKNVFWNEIPVSFAPKNTKGITMESRVLASAKSNLISIT